MANSEVEFFLDDDLELDFLRDLEELVDVFIAAAIALAFDEALISGGGDRVVTAPTIDDAAEVEVVPDISTDPLPFPPAAGGGGSMMAPTAELLW